MKESTRERRSLTADVERRTLQAVARKLPLAVSSDHLTVLGVLGALGAGAGYALSTFNPHWLWLASLMLVLNWFGDSLDGTVARIRRSERPRYGYYLDHAVDAFTTTIIGLGIGLSPFVSIHASLVLVILYLIMSINVYLESTVHGVFRMDYGVIGPTEARLILIALNAVLVGLTAGAGVPDADIRFYGTLLVALLAAGMLALLLSRFAGNLRQLAELEPVRRGEPAETAAPRRAARKAEEAARAAGQDAGSDPAARAAADDLAADDVPARGGDARGEST